ncbi:hypothetical protein QC764_300415 [Podospora pseudoanserina]|uniref:Infection structure specific protein n=1 Tax=Podospora pseudoanserina TaxID=2609844 RepID=A0ABR0IB45_9PEZI|nr:hypothetical protein QC764_300415 [Podospora pseudoanserina]
MMKTQVFCKIRYIRTPYRHDFFLHSTSFTSPLISRTLHLTYLAPTVLDKSLLHLVLPTYLIINMQSKNLLLTATLAASAMANEVILRQAQDENPAPSTTPIPDNSQPEPSSTIFTESQAVVSDGTPETITIITTTPPGTTLSTTTSGGATCGALVTSFYSAFPTPTGAYSTYLNSVISKGDVCALVRSVPATVSSAAAAYETALDNYFARPENLESILDVGDCLAATPSLAVAGANSAEVKFLAKATDLSKCKSAAPGISIRAAAVLAGVAAVACAFGMM